MWLWNSGMPVWGQRLEQQPRPSTALTDRKMRGAAAASREGGNWTLPFRASFNSIPERFCACNVVQFFAGFEFEGFEFTFFTIQYWIGHKQRLSPPLPAFSHSDLPFLPDSHCLMSGKVKQLNIEHICNIFHVQNCA